MNIYSQFRLVPENVANGTMPAFSTIEIVFAACYPRSFLIKNEANRSET